MVRSGGREAALAAALSSEGLGASKAKWTRPTIAALPGDLSASILTLYRELGGVQQEPRLMPAGWDLQLADGTLVELDEQQHFTRYRAASLALNWASDMPWRNAYLSHCRTHEQLAAGYGGFWTNPSTERQFGTAGTRGDFDGPGSPRAKQRAVYDAIRDAHAAAGLVRLARLSIYDDVVDTTLGAVLAGEEAAAPVRGALTELIAQRTLQP
ncbi:hypothetical protein [Brachybacterium sp. FME24]|uniref:DUF7255 family protein n=1 Tax=Brachybacterium sp. FME24 TaxID=2742605 RepID=UPI0018692ED0|nr:hypothetical protein [Brachybacterium sp. FME24]